MRVEFDPAKANLLKHRVSFADAEGVFNDPLALTIKDPDAEGERRFITIGLGSAGAFPVVVYTERNGGYRLVSARRAFRSSSITRCWMTSAPVPRRQERVIKR
ncbi:MAG: hypothetical protein H6R21_1118 [Proteobacteria bacterium]|nr:hypothetical protein [Pseudomonadota bacterium]